MASDSAWSEGWQTGTNLATAQRERKEALTDEERRLHVADLYSKGQALSKVIPTLSGEKRQKAMDDLAGIESGIQQVYHPDNAPTFGEGALAKDWHHLANLIHRHRPIPGVDPSHTFRAETPVTPPAVTMPTPAGMPVYQWEAQLAMVPSPTAAPAAGAAAPKPAPPISRQQQRAQAQAQVRQDAARRAAEIDVESQGLSPEEEAKEKERITEQTDEANRQWALDWATKHGIPVDSAVYNDLVQHLAGLPQPKPKYKPLPGSKPYKGQDNLWYQNMQDEEGNIVERPLGANYQPPPSSRADRYAWSRDAQGRPFSVLLDPATNQVVKGSENYNVVPPPGMLEHVTTGTYHFVDQDNNVIAVPESRTTTPVFSGTAAAPARPAGAPARAAGAGAAPAGATTPIRTNGAATATPAAPAKPAAAPAAPGAGVGRVIGKKGTPALNKARAEHATWNGMASLADNMVTAPSSEKDVTFVLALIKAEAGRVNIQEIKSIFNAGGLGMAPERWMAAAKNGQLTPALRKQLQDIVHQRVTAAQAEVDDLIGGSAPTPASLNKQAKDNVDAGLSDEDFLKTVK